MVLEYPKCIMVEEMVKWTRKLCKTQGRACGTKTEIKNGIITDVCASCGYDLIWK